MTTEVKEKIWQKLGELGVDIRSLIPRTYN